MFCNFFTVSSYQLDSRQTGRSPIVCLFHSLTIDKYSYRINCTKFWPIALRLFEFCFCFLFLTTHFVNRHRPGRDRSCPGRTGTRRLVRGPSPARRRHGSPSPPRPKRKNTTTPRNFFSAVHLPRSIEWMARSPSAVRHAMHAAGSRVGRVISSY